MAKTPSSMIPLGTQAPDFVLYDVVSEKMVSLSSLRSPVATVICFICNHCPFVIHINAGLIAVANDYQKKGVQFIAICSNNAETYPEDSPQRMKETAEILHYPFPYLWDETQAVAKAYHAACTPDFFMFDAALRCVYRGQMDDARPSNDIPVTGYDLRQALDNVLSNQAVTTLQKPSLGCNIKWK